jgi:hypothetical protein
MKTQNSNMNDGIFCIMPSTRQDKQTQAQVQVQVQTGDHPRRRLA